MTDPIDKDSTKTAVQFSRRGSFGIDAPYLLAVPALLVVWGIVQAVLSGSPWPLAGAALCSSAVVRRLRITALQVHRVGSSTRWARAHG